MGFYSNYIFPRILDWSLGNALMREQRREALTRMTKLRGHVLEIGFGTGLNLAFYPDEVTRLTAIDNERMLPGRVEKRIAEARVPVQQRQLDAGGRLPFEEGSFDGVVTTFTLCSILDVSAALVEIGRVLAPGGEYVFLEHGRSDDPRIAKRQDFFNPIQKLIACGCNMNRPIDTLVRDAGLQITQLHRYDLPDTPRVLGHLYRGVAKKQPGTEGE
ncbi:MAG: class I SAM-dependent methyltransferase [Blastocatellia bacterium]